jgi:hypothetical protein
MIYFLLTEASTPFVNLRWRLYVLNMTDQKKYIFVSMLMSVTFFVFRTIPLPFVIYYGIVKEGLSRIFIENDILFGFLQILGLTVLSILNSIWSFKILVGWFKILKTKFLRRKE